MREFAHVAERKYSRHVGLEQVRIAIEIPARGSFLVLHQIGAGQQEALIIAADDAIQPLRTWLGDQKADRLGTASGSSRVAPEESKEALSLYAGENTPASRLEIVKHGFHEIFMFCQRLLHAASRNLKVAHNVLLFAGRGLLAQGSLSRSIIAPSEDMTERKKAEQALRDAEDLQFRLIARTQDCVNVLDREGGLLWMNEGGMQALEICELGPFVNRSWIQFWKGEDQKAAQAAVEAAKKGGTCRFTGYLATTTRQPRWWDVVVSPIESAEGKPERLLVVSRDVSEQKRNERVLREAHLQVARSEERWRSVFENSAIGVALTDLNGRFLVTNSVYQKMVGYSDEELRALSFIDITHADYREANRALAAELRERKRQQFQIEKQYRCKNGSSIWVSNNVSLVPGTESTPQFIMALSEDITERKRAEEALRKSEQIKRSLLDINNAIITNLTEEA